MKYYFFLAAALFILVGADLWGVYSTYDLKEIAELKSKTHESISRIEKINFLLAAAESYEHAFTITKNPLFLEYYNESCAQLTKIKEELRPANLEKLNVIYGLIEQRLKTKDLVVGEQLVQKIYVLQEELKQEEESIFIERSRLLEEQLFTVIAVNITACIIGSIIIVVTFIFLFRQGQNLKEFATLFSMSRDMLCVANKTHFLKINDAMSKVLGYSKEELLSKPWIEFVHSEDVITSQTINEQLYTKDIVNYEVRYVTKTGEIKWLEWCCVPGKNKEEAYCVARDVTIRKEQEIKLATITAELEQFAYVASHDLKAPLRGITNLATWIEEELNDPKQVKEYLAKIKLRITRMNNLINGILQYSRVGRLNTEIEQINLNNLITEVIDSIDTKQFKISVQPSFPTVKGNKVTLGQVFVNLLSNAVKHHTREDGYISINWEEEANFYKFMVTDDGPGIDPKFQNKLFVMFQTLKPKDNVDSTGIGLALSKKIVEQAGGKIWVESDVDKGAKFSFSWAK